jgi:hypothetical protein
VPFKVLSAFPTSERMFLMIIDFDARCQRLFAILYAAHEDNEPYLPATEVLEV